MATDIFSLRPAHLEAKKGSEPAGFNIDGQKTDPDIIYSFDLYESFDIEFESSPSKSPSHEPLVKVTDTIFFFHRPGQLHPQVGRGHQGPADAEDTARPDRRGHEDEDIHIQGRAGDMVILLYLGVFWGVL